MNVLGISGWKDLSKNIDTDVSPLHDSAAALIIDGKISSMAEEERFTRQKYGYNSFPVNSIVFCLQEANLGPEDLDGIAVYWDFPLSAEILGQKWDMDDLVLNSELFPSHVYDKKFEIPVHYINHHLAHAKSAYNCSSFDEALVLVMDGQGEISSTTLWEGRNGNLSKILDLESKYSLGYFYQALTAYVGLESNEPGKTMGLSSYGKISIPTKEFFSFERGEFKLKHYSDVDITKDFDEQNQVMNYWFEVFSRYVSKPNSIKRHVNTEFPFDKEYINLAASGQNALEEIVSEIVEWGIEETGLNRVCIAGGVGLNCVMNGKLIQDSKIKNLFIQPISHDAGAALGAAIALTDQVKFDFDNVYLGPAYSDQFIEKEIIQCKLSYLKPESVEKEVAKLLNEGKLIGWFQGRMEVGPRALGNRSILANPKFPNAKDVVNRQVKFRENWRPFAPSILEEYKEKYLKGAKDSPYMILSFDVPNDKIDDLRGVVHVDGSVRAQTVSKNTNQRYWTMINEFRKLSGVPAVLNTSYNLKGEPIVCTPRDAIRTFYSSGLDYLAIGNFLIRK